MANNLQENSDIWESIYSNGHMMNYPDDAFVRLLHRFIRPEKGMTVMDYGFGSGMTSMHLARVGCEVSGLEISQTAIDLTRERLESEGYGSNLLKGEPDQDLPFDDNQFDFIVAWNSLTYNTVKTLEEKLEEFDRILKPKGKIVAAMSAPGDFIDENSTQINGIEKEINTTDQKGAKVIIPTEQDLKEHFFKGSELQLGQLVYDFRGFGQYQNKYWLLCYQKG